MRKKEEALTSSPVGHEHQLACVVLLVGDVTSLMSSAFLPQLKLPVGSGLLAGPSLPDNAAVLKVHFLSKQIVLQQYFESPSACPSGEIC